MKERRAKSWRGGKKEKGRDRVLSSPSFLPLYFRVRDFSIQQTRPSRSLEQAVAGGIVMPGVLSRRLSHHARRTPSAEAARKNLLTIRLDLLPIADTETTALVRLSRQLLKLASLAFILRHSRCWCSRMLARVASFQVNERGSERNL